MKIGDKASDFTLKDGDGNDWKLSEQRGKTVVLLFYPGDNTPVCTKQMCSVRDNWEDYAKTGAEVVGISTNSAESHQGFADKYDLPLTLLSDESGEVVEKYNMKSWLPNRSARGVVVIDKNGVIRHYQVQSLSLFRPKDDEILEAIKNAEKDNASWQ
ncbi:MAG: peroxiredoxin [Pyrinomonadaceae bacterium]